MIRIVNWLLTRKCNLKCDYCNIVKNYEMMPTNYPSMNHYHKNEMTTDVVINALANFKKHNPDCFHIFYGGEPLLRSDLPEIINYCNENKIAYTIISNNTPGIQGLIYNLFNECDYIEGFTSSVDPITMDSDKRADRIKKSIEGFQRLKDLQSSGKVKDVVAEITVMDENKHSLLELVCELSEFGIYSDITFVDICKSPYYDFSNVTDENVMLKPSLNLAHDLITILNDSSLLVHMKDILLPKMFNALPSNYDCGLEHGIHNVAVDADGSMRLCLRIRGTLTPYIHVSELFEKETGLISKDYYDLICIDKRRHCKLCNHSCYMMSEHINNTGQGTSDLIHSNKRR